MLVTKMTDRRITLVAVAFILSLLPTWALGARQFPVEATERWQAIFDAISPVNLGDSTDGFLCIMGSSATLFNRQLEVMSGSGRYDREVYDKEPLEEFGNPRCGGTGLDSMWVTHVRGDSVFVDGLWPHRSFFVTKGEDRYPPHGWVGNADQVEITDLNADGRAEAVVNVGCGFDGRVSPKNPFRPRGLFALDWSSGKLLWKYTVGPNITTPFLVKDVDNDGKEEILCGTHRNGSDNDDNGMDDTLAYVFLLDCDGHCRWRRQIGVYSSQTFVGWLDGPQAGPPLALVCECGGPAGGRERDSLFVLDASDGHIVRRAQYGAFNRGFSVIHDIKGRTRIAVANSDDTLRLLDTALKMVKKTAMHGGGATQMCSAHFSGAAGDEIAVALRNGILTLYDCSLNQTCQFGVGDVQQLIVVRTKGAASLLAQSAGNPTSWSLYGLTPVRLWNRGVAFGVVAGGAAFFLLLFTVALVYARYQRTRDIRSVIRSLTGRAGTIELNRRGEVTSINQRARELLGTRDKRVTHIPTQGPFASLSELARAMLTEPEGTPPRELAVSIAPGQTSMVRCVRVKTGAVLTIEDISAVEYLERVKAWAPVAQKLAHGIKNPLNTILGSVEQIELKVSDEKARKYMGYVKDEVTRLRKMSDAFMRFTKLNPPALQPKNVNEVIKKVMTKYECRMTNGATRQDAKEDGFNTKAQRHEEEPGVNHQESELATKARRHEEESGMNRQDAKNAKEDGFNTKTQRHEEEAGMNRQESGLNTKTQRHEGESGPAGIELRLELDEKLPAIALDEEGLSNALEIVIENAVEAMSSSEQIADSSKQRRTLSITTCRHIPNSPSSSVRSVSSVVQDCIRIEIADTGKGIPAKYLDKVFEPYFTMGKPQGTGLGLALAKKIIEDHKGKVEIESHEGIGTRVSILLPIKS